MSILVVEAFVRLRTLIAGNRELAVRVEKLETNQLEISSIINRLDDCSRQFLPANSCKLRTASSHG